MSKVHKPIMENQHYKRTGEKVRIVCTTSVKDEFGRWADGLVFENCITGYRYAMTEEKFLGKFERC